MTDWFRIPCVDDASTLAFESRLARSRRPANRSQYLRIQALELADIGKHEKSIAMLKRAADIDPNTLELCLILEQRAECEKALGHTEAAIEYFRKSIERVREKPNIKGRATLHFPLWIAENEMRPYFAEALEILDEFWNPHPIFPLEEFRQHACKAILFAGIGRINEAKTEAFLAMSAAQKTESKARYHRSTGLITDSDLPLVNRMKNLSASKQSLPSWISALFKGKK